MSKRTTSCKLAMKALYQSEIQGSEIQESLTALWQDREYIEETRSFAEALAVKVHAEKEALDAKIMTYAKNWTLDRMNPIDKQLMRIAIYEIQYDKQPYQVIINEMVMIAKKYSTEEGAKFINGILEAFSKDTCSQG